MMDLSEPEPEKRYSSMMDLSEVDRSKRRMYQNQVIHEDTEAEPGMYNKDKLKHYRSEEYLAGHSNPSYSSLKRIRSPDFIKSNESLSSGKRR